MTKKRKAREDELPNETWLIPYADLLTLLLALFIVLFASSQTDTKKFEQIMAAFNSVMAGGTGVFRNSSIVPIGDDLSIKPHKVKFQDEANPDEQDVQQFQQDMENLQKLKKQIDEYIKENGLSAQLQTGLNTRSLVLRISDNALFSSGSADIKAQAQNLAKSISQLLENYPQYNVVVSGHTDNVPIHNSEFQSNWDLSTKRALNFMKILLNDSKLNPARFSAVGYGEYRPIASNDTEEGRAKNRRVEVSINRVIQADEDNAIDDGTENDSGSENSTPND